MNCALDFVMYRLCLSQSLKLLAYRPLGGVTVAVVERASGEVAAYAFRGYFEIAQCQVFKRPVDAPFPPVPISKDSAERTRLVARGDGEVIALTALKKAPDPTNHDPSCLLTYLYFARGPLSSRLQDIELPYLPRSSFPGSGRLVGEEFRIAERDADYLRLVGRGGDEYIAWDFVLGTLDSGEWIIMADDGLYVAKREGSRVVVKEPYRGSIYDVRGPPYAPYYPVVPVKWVRERLERAEAFATRRGIRDLDIYQPPVDPVYLLKWPLVQFPWEYEVVCSFKPYGSARLVDCGRLCRYINAPWCGEFFEEFACELA
ncbi:MAG: hypothetical protein QXI84_09390 [Thermofilaceae archaeon]